MRRTFLLALAAGTMLAQAPAPPKTHLKVGDQAPAFKLGSTKGGQVSLADFAGKSTVVLAFFPAAFTGGWTKELRGYQAGIQKFKDAGAEVFMVSTDNLPTLGHWAKEENIEFAMLSDFMRKAAADYGVLMPERGIANRATFVIDAKGVIQHIEEGSGAIDISGAATACSRLKH